VWEFSPFGAAKVLAYPFISRNVRWPPRYDKRMANHTRQGRPLEERLWSRVDKTGPLPWRPELGPCWLWTGAKIHGYGTIRRGGQNGGPMVGTHRIAYELTHGPIPKGLQIDHLCRVPSCIRPSHLEAVTPRENGRRGVSSNVQITRPLWQTHCNRNHKFTPENTYVNPSSGSRVCRNCLRAAQAKWRAEHPGYNAAVARRYYAQNREKINAKRRKTSRRSPRRGDV
jgi:HNH endonuclease